MKSQFIKKMKNQSGQIAIATLLLTVTFLILGGIAIDIGNIFFHKARLQRSLDASIIAGLKVYARKTTNNAGVEAATRQMLQYNLNQMGISAGEITQNTATLTVSATEVATLLAQATVRIDTVFVRLAGFPTVNISGRASGQRKPAAVSLVLDVSTSMAIPAADPELPKLKKAAKLFVFSFDEVDRMSIDTFGNVASNIRSMDFINKPDLADIIDAITIPDPNIIQWQTAMSAGIANGRLQFNQTLIDNPDMTRAMLMFNDGAPTVMNYEFIDPIAPPLPAYPNYFIYAQIDPLNRLIRRVTDPATGRNLPGHECWDSFSVKKFQQCFNTYRYRDSKGNIHGASVSLSGTAPDVPRECYHASIVESDYVRDDDITVFTIGLGDLSFTPTDAYQGYNDNYVKSVLLRRIANDPAGTSDPAFIPPYPRPGSSEPEGLFFETPDANELIGLFVTVAKNIQARLVE